jgi:hypothetical protein
MPRSRLPNLLTNYAPRGIRNQGRPLKRLLDEWDWNRPTMAYFPESKAVMMMMMNNFKFCLSLIKKLCLILDFCLLQTWELLVILTMLSGGVVTELFVGAILLLVFLYHVSNVFRYYFKFAVFIVISLMSATMYIPLMLWRPRSYKNALWVICLVLDQCCIVT